MRALALAISAAVLAGCATLNDVVPDNIIPGERAPDPTLEAILHAAPRTCPNGRTLENARVGSDNQSRGVTVEELMLVPLSDDPTHALRLRRIIMAPHSVLAWHTHEEVQGAALIVSGDPTEYRSDCMDPIRYHAGDIAREDAATAHGWRNESDREAVVITAHVVPR